MKLLITGATGLIGSEITRQAQLRGYTIHYLTTDTNKIEKKDHYRGFYWNTETGEVNPQCLNGVSKIINLAGASISQRWTKEYKQTIIDSRVNSIKTLYKLLKENAHRIDQFCSASAMGIYPSSLSKRYNENETGINAGFLGKVVKTWEHEADTIAELGIVVTKIRIGLVLTDEGGVLQEMAKPIKMGVGAAIGSGKQWQSWIHIKDLANLFLFTLENGLDGIFNGVASNPVSNKELTKALAHNLNRSIFLPNVPEFAIKLALGEMATITLESQFLLNDKIKDAGFVFEFENLEKALTHLFK